MKVRPFHHQRPLAAAAAAYGIGVWAGVAFAWRPWLYAAGLALALAAAALLPRAGRKRAAGAAGAMLFLGMLLAGWASHPALPPEGSCRVTGTAAGDIRLREDGTAAGYLEGVRLETEEGTVSVGRAYWTFTPENDALPSEGDTVAFEGRVYAPHGRENPYGFDFRMYLLQKGVSIGISGGSGLALTGHHSRGLASVTYQARRWMSERMDAVFGADSDLPKALLIGQKSDLPRETVQGFTDAGAAHVLAVSGLHTALLAAVLMAPLKKRLRPGGRFLALGVFLAAYCALLDFSAPVVRASVLLMIAAGRRIVRRAGDRITALSAAFLLILLFRPLDLFSASFQLSFCAVLGIALMAPWLERSMPHFFRTGLGITLAATAGAAVPTAQIFHRLSLIGLLINPLVCAAFTVLLPAYFLTAAAGCLWLSAGQFLAGYLNAATRWVVSAITAAGNLPFAVIRLPYLPWYCVLALAAAALLATRYTVWPARRKAAAAFAALLCAFGFWRLTVCRDVRYIQLSMGQADSALILDGEKTAVIDAGEYGGDTASFLLSEGRKADYLILTHLHMDHCGGVRELLNERVPVGAVYLPEGAEEQAIDPRALEILEDIRKQGIPILHVAAGEEILLPRGRLEAVWPQKGRVRAGQDANRYSMALLCEMDGVRLLLAGDMTGDYENYAARDADILKAAHHGSKSGTGAVFLAAVAPQAVILTGGGNAWLPHPDTLQRIEDAGAVWFDTARSGAVTVVCRAGEARITVFLKEQE